MCHFYHAWECHERKYTKKGDERKQNDSGLIKVWQNHENYENSEVKHSPECHRKEGLLHVFPRFVIQVEQILYGRT